MSATLALSSTTWPALREAYLEASGSGQLQRYCQRRWGQASEFLGWLSAGELSSLSMEQALALYRASGGNRIAEFKSNPIEEVQDSLDFLLYDAIKLEGRFGECAADGGAYKLAGAGKEFVSYLLCLRDPKLFAVWNSYGERALQLLGMYPHTLRKGPLGLRYIDWLEAAQKVGQRLGVTDFQVVDEFCYWETKVWHGAMTS